MVITCLMSVKVELDGANKPMETDALPVLSAQLVNLVHGVRPDHRELLKRYHDDPVLRAAIDPHDENTSFDVPWPPCPGKCDYFCAFSGDLATILTSTVAEENDCQYSSGRWTRTASI
uniref:Uncharacterized protein n=1 Tax=Hyaloperonospora arabidopsidis (strain Emoy2) TaxID=559515 RepID=M4BS80_HYAAE